MNHYELLYLISGQSSEEEMAAIAKKVKELIGRADGKITLEDNLGHKKLAYPIKHNFAGIYLLYEFDLEPKNLKKLNADLKLTNEILRHLIITKSEKAPRLVEITKEKAKKEKIEGKEKEGEKKIKLEELDKKLDELLQGDII